MTAPLEGVKVLDLTRLIVGGYYGMLLADAGADVVKVEVPRRGDTLRAWSPSWWKVYGRGKKSITLDLTKVEGQALLKNLAAEADVLAENFFPGKLESWGLSPGELHEVNPRLVIVRISGWGQDGPYRDRPGFGTLVEAASGFSALNGFPDSPPLLPPVPIADMTAGLYGVASTMFALYRRDALGGGKGQVIDLALYEPLFTIIGPHAAEFVLNGKKYKRTGNLSENSSPRNCYPTSDNRWIAISASTQPMFERLVKGLDRADLISDPRFKDNITRVANNPELDAIVAAEIGQRTCEENMGRFVEGGVTAMPIYDIEDIIADPHFRERELIKNITDPDFGEVPMQNTAPRMSETPQEIRWTGPALGAHTSEILGEWLGMAADDVDALRRDGVI
jgi:crotonobetainyl-CoA:carnitine CoA-transferase CaiB-like acyl-CoA transferase